MSLDLHLHAREEVLGDAVLPAGGAAGGDDVFDNDRGFAGGDFKAAAEGHLAIGVAFVMGRRPRL